MPGHHVWPVLSRHERVSLRLERLSIEPEEAPRGVLGGPLRGVGQYGIAVLLVLPKNKLASRQAGCKLLGVFGGAILRQKNPIIELAQRTFGELVEVLFIGNLRHCGEAWSLFRQVPVGVDHLLRTYGRAAKDLGKRVFAQLAEDGVLE